MAVDVEELRQRAWRVIDACQTGGLLAAAAESALYPHVWTRDVGVAALGILAAARGDDDAAMVARSLAALARCQDRLGRLPLKIDPVAEREVKENSAGVDGGAWFAIAVDALATVAPAQAEPLREPALRALAWTEHLDVNGEGLLVSPEASDWADMMPHRHHVLALNVLFAAALEAGCRLGGGEAMRERAARVRALVDQRFSVDGLTEPAAAGAELSRLADASFEWGLTGQYATRYGDLPFYLPYVGFRAIGRHCDVVGNCLAVITGVAGTARAQRLLRYLEAVGADQPAPSVAIYPPILPGDPDWRDHFHWRNLNLPHHYQNGGAWPFIGAFHVAAEVAAGHNERAADMLERLAAGCLRDDFPEWRHGQTGRAMGEPRQLWSATGTLYALEAARRGRPPFLSPAP